ncbi:MAG: M48 family metallopeptidase [Burkholderiales bacterium]|nr:M48 family metallopeptidase [Burkholderiales bacterium]
MTNAFAGLFVGALAAAVALRLWLAVRQVRHVRAHRGAVPPPFRDAVPLEAHAKAADYAVARTRLGAAQALADAAALVVLTFGGLLEALARAWAVWLAPEGLAHGLALIGSVAALLALLDLPFALWRVFAIEARFGFNRMTPRLFVVDLAKQTAVALVLGAPLVALVLWLMQAAGERWWLWAWLAWTAFNVLVLVAWPTLIAPLFNRFTPLADPALAGRIAALLARCGFRADGVYVMDGSRRSAHGNAYFTGVGAAKRVVLFDTLLARLAPAEVEAVLAHELGHYRHRHVPKRLALAAGVSFALLWLLAQAAAHEGFYAALGVQTRTPATALVLFFLVVPVFAFFLQPLLGLLSRRDEYEADAYAAAQSSARDLAQALVKLYRDNAATLTPDPLHSAFYDTHPPAAARIARLRTA